MRALKSLEHYQGFKIDSFRFWMTTKNVKNGQYAHIERNTDKIIRSSQAADIIVAGKGESEPRVCTSHHFN